MGLGCELHVPKKERDASFKSSRSLKISRTIHAYTKYQVARTQSSQFPNVSESKEACQLDGLGPWPSKELISECSALANHVILLTLVFRGINTTKSNY